MTDQIEKEVDEFLEKYTNTAKNGMYIVGPKGYGKIRQALIDAKKEPFEVTHNPGDTLVFSLNTSITDENAERIQRDIKEIRKSGEAFILDPGVRFSGVIRGGGTEVKLKDEKS